MLFSVHDVLVILVFSLKTVVVRERDSRLKSRSISYLLGNDPAMPDTSEGQAALVMQRLVSLKIVSANKGRLV